MNHKDLALKTMHHLQKAAQSAYAAYWVEDEARQKFLWEQTIEALDKVKEALTDQSTPLNDGQTIAK